MPPKRDVTDDSKRNLKVVALTVGTLAVLGSAFSTLAFHLSIPDRVREHDAKFIAVDKAMNEQKETLIRIEERLIAVQTQLKMREEAR